MTRRTADQWEAYCLERRDSSRAGDTQSTPYETPYQEACRRVAQVIYERARERLPPGFPPWHRLSVHAQVGWLRDVEAGLLEARLLESTP